jgi:glycerophosphoryl diester phosphodiesterase
VSRLRPSAAAGLVASLAVLGAVPATTSAKSAATGHHRTVAIHAHRGGSVLAGKPAYPENTLPAFRAAAKRGDVLELDVHVTQDGVPVVLHDGKLDRTTACTGVINTFTLAALRACPSDVLGSPGSALRSTQVARPSVAIPALADVLAVAKRAHATVDVEINDYPTDPSYDPTPAFADHVMDVLIRSGLPKRQVVVQSFLGTNLDAATKRWPGVPTAQITFGAPAEMVDQAAKAKRQYLFPQAPVPASFVKAAHARGLKVVPYTLDTATAVRAAVKAGVDGVITDDPVMARKTVSSTLR